MIPTVFGVGTISLWNTFPIVKVWMLNLLTWWAWLTGQSTGDMTAYYALVAAGQPCYVQVSSANLPLMGLGDTSPQQPVCWYDPGNVNAGFMVGEGAARR